MKKNIVKGIFCAVRSRSQRSYGIVEDVVQLYFLKRITAVRMFQSQKGQGFRKIKPDSLDFRTAAINIVGGITIMDKAGAYKSIRCFPGVQLLVMVKIFRKIF